MNNPKRLKWLKTRLNPTSVLGLPDERNMNLMVMQLKEVSVF